MARRNLCSCSSPPSPIFNTRDPRRAYPRVTSASQCDDARMHPAAARQRAHSGEMRVERDGSGEAK